MRRRYPKAENVKYLLCEQVRPELNKKLTLMGLYAGDQIVFLPAAPGQFPYTLAGLAFVYIMKGGLGEFEARFKLLDPDNKPTYEVTLDPIKIESDATAGVVVQLGNVQFNSEGDYTAVLLLGNKRYNFPIRISSASAQIPNTASIE